MIYLLDDPNELVNLAKEPGHQGILVEMREMVDAWIEDTGDNGQFPESKAALQIVKDQFPTMAISPEFLDL